MEITDYKEVPFFDYFDYKNKINSYCKSPDSVVDACVIQIDGINYLVDVSFSDETDSCKYSIIDKNKILYVCHNKEGDFIIYDDGISYRTVPGVFVQKAISPAHSIKVNLEKKNNRIIYSEVNNKSEFNYGYDYKNWEDEDALISYLCFLYTKYPEEISCHSYVNSVFVREFRKANDYYKAAVDSSFLYKLFFRKESCKDVLDYLYNDYSFKPNIDGWMRKCLINDPEIKRLELVKKVYDERHS